MYCKWQVVLPGMEETPRQKYCSVHSLQKDIMYLTCFINSRHIMVFYATSVAVNLRKVIVILESKERLIRDCLMSVFRCEIYINLVSIRILSLPWEFNYATTFINSNE